MMYVSSAAPATAPRKAASDGPARIPHIPEIDGLRGVAIALIIIYHIWLNRVSGGVDVFFLLSGFVITMSLIRAAEQEGRVRFARYYARVVRRIVPPALVTLVGVVVATVVWLPQTRWRDTLGDIVASATYLVNWRLAENAVDYLASQNAASPVQHYWSLAVQGQFYLLWPVLVAAGVLLAARLALPPRWVLSVLLGVVFTGSLGYAVLRTATNQTYAYFDTFARLWEFALGGLLVLALPYLRLPRPVRSWLSWGALAAVAVCGLVFRAGSEFPGWPALWPTVAAAALVAATAGGDGAGAGRLLRTRALRTAGDLSYALYLWHWPVLICYLAVVDRAVPSARGGLLVIGVSIVLALASKRLLEDRLRRSGSAPRPGYGSFALAAGFLAIVLATTAALFGVIGHQQRQAEAAAETVARTVPGSYPGAAYLAHGGELPDVPYRPGPLTVNDDHSGVLYPGCHQNQEDSEAIVCELGPADTERSIAVIGGSRAEHWLPAMEVLGHRYGWRILAMTKSACLFSVEPRVVADEPYTSCDEWNENVMAELARRRPDAVLTTSTRVSRTREITPDGYIGRWRTLDDLGIRVLAIRDIPRPQRDVPDCVERYGASATICGNDPDVYGLDLPAAVAERADIPDNVDFLDLTRFLCTSDLCPAVIGNVLVYHDASHLTATYARTLAPFLGEAVLAATGW